MLMSSADGYTYYYIFEKIPGDLKFMRAGISPEMDSYGITFLNPDNNRVKLFVFSKPVGYKPDYGGWDTISVDGVMYYYHQRPVPEGGQFNPDRMAAYFQWEHSGKVILVHPKEPITEDVIRKYNKLIKVEFNIGEHQVGMDTNLLLIKDMDKIISLIRDNPEIHFQTDIILMSAGSFC